MFPYQILIYIYQEQIQEFQNRGHCPVVVEFFGVWGLFGAPSHIPYLFVMSVENKRHIVNIEC